MEKFVINIGRQLGSGVPLAISWLKISVSPIMIRKY